MSLIEYNTGADGSFHIVLRRADFGPERVDGMDGDILVGSISPDGYKDIQHAKTIINEINHRLEGKCPLTT